jgi:hypothetical protein
MGDTPQEEVVDLFNSLNITYSIMEVEEWN